MAGVKKMVAGQLSKHFFRHEFACQCGCGFDTVDAELIRVIADLREKFRGRRVHINSGCRCPKHNKAEGGSRGSFHTKSKAIDFWVEDVHADTVADFLEETYPNQYGIGRYNNRTHLDVREKVARWDKR